MFKRLHIRLVSLCMMLLIALAATAQRPQITERLNAIGVNISRRTVAKYRMAMKIPGKAERAAFH